jgi:hypothetical protein
MMTVNPVVLFSQRTKSHCEFLISFVHIYQLFYHNHSFDHIQISHLLKLYRFFFSKKFLFRSNHINRLILRKKSSAKILFENFDEINVHLHI